MSEQEAQVTFLFWCLVTSDGEASSSAKGGRSSPHHPGTQSGAARLGDSSPKAWDALLLPCSLVLPGLPLYFNFKGLLVVLVLSISTHLPGEAI